MILHVVKLDQCWFSGWELGTKEAQIGALLG